ncbi:MAG: ribulose-phosphate 3-epimerase [Spirochaetaceae bacterium]
MAQPKISASILDADFLHLKQQIDEVIADVDEIHLDVMDGVFVDNISFGPSVIAQVRAAYPGAFLDTHLMISRPEALWRSFADAGSNVVTFHYEVTPHAYILCEHLRTAGVQAGVSVTPATDVRVLEPIREHIDRVLVLTVEPGFGGQSFIPAMLRKIENARALLGDEVDIEVDGGIKDATVADAQKAGANVFVAGSYFFKAADPRERVLRLRELIGR